MTNQTHVTRKTAVAPKSKRMEVTANREYKSTVFSLLYHEPQKLLSLYNALNHSHYSDPDELTIVTLKNAVYMAMKNDVAFVLDYQLHLYEHQSTPNPNMPLRNLFYVSREYEKMVAAESLYASRKVKIPAPRFVVFYNGTTKQPEKQLLRLSDLYEVSEEPPRLELQVEFFNINKGYNQQLKEECQSLKEYMLFVDRVREYADNGEKSLDQAVEQAVTECIQEGILAEFLEANRREVVAMSIFEYDEEKEKRLFREAERIAGREEGREEGRAEGLKEGERIGRERERALGLKALVTSLQKYLPDFEAVFQEVISTEEYKDCTRQQVQKYYTR